MKKLIAIIISVAIILTFTSCNGDFDNVSDDNYVGNNPPPTDLKEAPASDFGYVYDEELGGIIINSYRGNDLTVRIPAFIDKQPVISIGDNAFEESTIEYVYIPDDILSIGISAFKGCINLTTITIPDSVTEVGSCAFKSCTGLTSVTIGIGVKRLKGDEFSGCHKAEINRLGVITDDFSVVTTDDVIQFAGTYWWVLDIHEDKILVLSEDIFFKKEYHYKHEETTWEQSDLREYLNGEFYEDTFTADEKRKIIETNVINNNYRDAYGGNDTIDKVFLLSRDEIGHYFITSSEQGIYRAGITFLWLRSPVFSNTNTAFSDYEADFIESNESLDWHLYGVSVSPHVAAGGSHGSIFETNGVRPAIWISIN